MGTLTLIEELERGAEKAREMAAKSDVPDAWLRIAARNEERAQHLRQKQAERAVLRG